MYVIGETCQNESAMITYVRDEIMKNSPLISVIMSVYNEEQYVENAVRSILNQTVQNFEIIIYDDCSTDATADLIEAIGDERIKLYRNSDNCGLTQNLNKGLQEATGKYIARMDGDDVSLPDRFEKQVKYLEQHPQIMLISCWTQNFGESHLQGKLRESSDELKVRMLIRPVFAHPGFMMRKELIDNGYRYDETFRTAQDYDLASRVAEKYEIGIVQEILLYYRVHKKQVSSLAGSEQFSNADRVRERLWRKGGVLLSAEEKKALQSWAKEERLDSITQYVDMNNLIIKILEANKTSNVYRQDILERTLNRLLYIWVIRSRKLSYLLAFPLVCGYRLKSMVLFIEEFFSIIAEKLQNRGIYGDKFVNIKAKNL